MWKYVYNSSIIVVSFRFVSFCFVFPLFRTNLHNSHLVFAIFKVFPVRRYRLLLALLSPHFDNKLYTIQLNTLSYYNCNYIATKYNNNNLDYKYYDDNKLQ